MIQADLPVDRAPGTADASGDHDRRPQRWWMPHAWVSTPFRIGLVALVGLTTIWRAWTMLSWSWFMDDWVYLASTTDMPFGRYLTQNYNGHIMPGQFLLAWVLTHVAPLNYAAAVGTTLVFIIASLITWAAAYTTIFGERFHLLIGLTVLGLSPIFLPISLWWAAGLQIFPLQLCMGLCVLFAARYALRPDRVRSLLWLGVSYAGGLLFWEKALLAAVPAVFVAWMLLDAHAPRRLRRLASVMGVLAAVAMAYVPVYVALTRGGDSAKTKLFEPRGFGESLSFYFHGILDVGLPALLGGPWSALSNPQAVYENTSGTWTLLLLAAAVVVAVVGLSMRRRALIPISMTLAYAALSWGLLLTSSRYAAMGFFAVRDARYAADILPVGLLSCMLLLGATVSERAHTPWMRYRLAPPTVRVLRGAAAALVLVLFLSTSLGNGAAWDAASPHSPKPWVDNLLRDAKKAGPVSVYDSMAPNSVILSAYFWGDGRVSRMLRPLGLPLSFNQPASTMKIVDANGRLQDLAVQPIARNVEPVPVANCGYLVKPGEKTFVPLTKQMFAWQWGVQFATFSQLGGLVRIRSDHKTATIRVGTGLTQTQLILEDSVSSLMIEGDVDAGAICLTSISIGPVQPQAQVPAS